MSSSNVLAERTNKRNSADESETENTSSKKSLKKTATTPFDLYFEKLKKFQKDNNFVGQMLVKGISRSNDDEDDDDEDDSDDEEKEDDTSKYTKEQMEGLRYILITKNRSDQLEEMKKFILGDQADSCFMMFSTSFSYEIMDSLDKLRKKLSRTKKTSDKLDMLFAYTFMVKEYDCWMEDNEGGMDVFTKGLAGIWKRLLKKSDQELGLDTEYTKPALLEMLQQFRDRVESLDSCYGDMKFRYK